MIASAALPDGAIPLAVGTVLALGGLLLVLSPLWDGGDADPAPAAHRRPDNAATEHAEIPADSAVMALREIEFDRETGKLSDDDYADLKARYTALALDEMRAASVRSAHTTAQAVVVSPDPLEALIQRARESQPLCQACGPRPEVDADYCSDCGRCLMARCPKCGSAVTATDSRFCSHCGEPLVVASSSSIGVAP